MDSLPNNILQRILEFSADFVSLRSTARVSKRLYGVFSEHPKTIERGVGWNYIGPALPQAVRLVRYKVRAGSGDGSVTEDSDEEIEEDSQPMEEKEPDVTSLTKNEQKLMEEYVEAAVKLEDMFSFRYKDRSSTTSKLSATESHSFRRATFRLMLFSRIFHVKLYYREGMILDFFGGGGEWDAHKAQDLNAKTAFLVGFSSEDLREIYVIAQFIIEIAKWTSYCSVGGSDIDCLPELALVVGPTKVIYAYETGRLEPILETVETAMGMDAYALDEFFEGYLFDVLNSIWEERMVTSPALPTELDNTLWYSILETIQEHDVCKFCHAARGVNLWNKSNWTYLQGLPDAPFSSNTITALLTGKLGTNDHVKEQLLGRCDKISPPERRVFLAKTLDESFALRTPEYTAKWTSVDDLLCTECLKELISEHLHVWLLASLRAAGEQGIDKDCWYGYDCRTQAHNDEHAKKLNHLCTPKRR